MEGILIILRCIGLFITLFAWASIGYGLWCFWNHEILMAMFAITWGFIGKTVSKVFFNL